MIQTLLNMLRQLCQLLSISANKMKILLTKTNKEVELSKCCLQNSSIKLACVHELMVKCLHGFMKECQVGYQLT